MFGQTDQGSCITSLTLVFKNVNFVTYIQPINQLYNGHKTDVRTCMICSGSEVNDHHICGHILRADTQAARIQGRCHMLWPGSLWLLPGYRPREGTRQPVSEGRRVWSHVQCIYRSHRHLHQNCSRCRQQR